MVVSADRFEIATMYRIMGLMQFIGRCRLVDCMYVTDFDIYSQKQYDDRQKDHSKKFMTRYENNHKDDDKIKYLLDIPYYDYRAGHKNKKI